MNFKYSYLLLFFMNIFLGYSQENKKYLVTYLEKRIASKEELKKFESYPTFIKNKLLKEVNEGEVKMLFLDEETSYYSLKSRIKTSKTIGDKTIRITTSDYYKDFKKELIIIEKDIRDNKVIIRDELHPFKWNLIDETKKISSFICKKATSLDFKGREITAWYTADVKNENGPHKYGGLPGLILELQTKYKSIEFKEIETTNSKEEIVFPSLKSAITMEDFKKEYNSKNNLKRKARYN